MWLMRKFMYSKKKGQSDDNSISYLAKSISENKWENAPMEPTHDMRFSLPFISAMLSHQS